MRAIPQMELYVLPRQTVCYATSATYPMSAPYSKNMDPSEPYGVGARITQILFSTLLATRSRDYYPITRKLIIGDDSRKILKRMNTCTGGRGVASFTESLKRFAAKPFPDMNGEPVQPFEEATIESGFFGTHLTLTEEYERRLLDHPREIPVAAITRIRGAVQLDLLMIAALYCPENRILAITLDDLRSLLPASSKSTLSRGLLTRGLSIINGAQDVWKFALKNEYLTVKPLNVLLEDNHTVILRRKQ
ncbi:hypothetical protein [Bifidobacterium sp. SO1]|uniref:hypothetical protein n=1 Tax=Bifidobacterium sp. SO1 TaxID=2809029 RepID=UPI001BDBC06B|nr:hypothetical protein [Bifidobacterium sp. SO1]MBT1162151.1 hypothetical protein [Bifidobacterium sp. SO1]